MISIPPKAVSTTDLRAEALVDLYRELRTEVGMEPKRQAYANALFGIPLVTSPYVPETIEESEETTYRRPLWRRLLSGRTIEYAHVDRHVVFMIAGDRHQPGGILGNPRALGAMTFDG